MTLLLADVASWQGSLTLAQIRAAGFDGVNLKVSHGLTQRTVHERAADFQPGALVTFHWLTGDAPGDEQARYAYAQLIRLALHSPGVAHVVDVEGRASNVGGEPTAEIYRTYVETMSGLLGRAIVTYTGDWWAADRPWLAPSPRSPWLMGAPADGYQREYPGDDSSMWDAGYAGYESLSIMQYRVAPIAGVNVSQSAVRDPDIWADMTGAPHMPSQAYRDWLADGQPWKFAVPIKAVGDRLRAHGYTVYYQGNDAHLKKAVPEDHTPFSATGWPGKSPYPYCMAMDIMPPDAGQKSKITGEPLPSLQKLGAQLVADRKAGVDGAAFVKYINWEPERNNGGPCYQDSWRPGYARRSSTDRGHIHVSGRTDHYLSSKSAGYDLVARTLGEDDDMTPAEMTAWAKSAEGKAAIGAAVADAAMPAPAGSNDPDGKWLFRTYVTNIYNAVINTRGYAADARSTGAEILAAVKAGGVDVQALANALAPVLAPLLPDDQDITPEVLREAFRGL